MSQIEQEESKRFFNDELDTSEVSLNFKSENKESFLFANSDNDKESVSVSETPEDEGEKTFPSAVKEVVKDDQDQFIGELQRIIPEMPMSLAVELNEKFSSQSEGLSLALSHYFDHYNGKLGGNLPSSPTQVNTSPDTSISALSPSPSHVRKRKNYGFRNQTRLEDDITWKRFIGALQVTGMATRPTVRPLKYGSQLKLKRSSEEISATKVYDSRGRKKTSMASLVRIYDIQYNREIGRVPEDIAQILYPLLSSSEISFEATLVFCDNKRLSIGDSFILQLDCFLTSTIFEESSNDDLSFMKKRRTERDNKREKDNTRFGRSLTETDEELENRSKRLALLKLFDRLKLKPILDEQKALEKHKIELNSDPEVIDIDDDEINADQVTEVHEDPRNTQHEEETMNLNQLKTFYKAAQSSDSLKSLPETEPSRDVFKLELRNYQKQGLTWMLRREQEFAKAASDEETLETDANMINPLWKQFKWPTDMSWASQKARQDHVNLEDDIFFYANLHSGEFSLAKPILKTMIKGGILSDEMGLGKTVAAYSLILSCPYDTSAVDKKPFDAKTTEGADDIPSSFTSSSQDNKKPYASKTTLIVVPMSLLTQWGNEFTKANNSSDMYHEVYYGGNVSSLKTLLTKTRNPPTVVLTTYGIVQNEWTKHSKGMMTDEDVTITSGLFSVDFYRIIIDEGHNIRNRTTATSKAIMDLQGKCKWVLTGTPIINRLDDLYSLVKFLKLDPWRQINYWKTFVSTPFENKNYKQAFDVVNAILEPVLLRRTKQMKDTDGNLLVELPPKEVVIKKLPFSKSQDVLYKFLLDKAETSVKSGIARGDLLKKYSTILVHILRLRQVCCHPELIGTQDENDEDLSKNNKLVTEQTAELDTLVRVTSERFGSSFTKEDLETVMEKLRFKYPDNESLQLLECSICTAEPINLDNVVFTECGHSFCEKCLFEYVEFQNGKELPLKCPNCREPIDGSRLLALRRQNVSPGNVEFKAYTSASKSSKITALMKELQLLQDSSAGEQVVIFSQFSTYLDILEMELTHAFPNDVAKIYKFDGRLSLKERTSVLADFAVKDYSRQKILLLSLKAGGVGLNLTCASHAYMMDPWWSPSMEDQAIDRLHRIGQTSSVKVVRFIVQNSIEEKMLRIQEKKRTIGEAMDADEDERRKRRIEEIQMLFE
ncbi:DNA helicase RAD5 [Saccharomyces eubayanus]|uniref:DNA helicase RAD5 n=1 Tax=Saccharomyces eubayanus TaxID=1080349 RepID=UPI0006C35998|nr:RAD5-like protein [Saccharomyces eubayanus]KOG97746.1 RAD5-like protein [Saccharomyces eubayanus]